MRAWKPEMDDNFPPVQRGEGYSEGPFVMNKKLSFLASMHQPGNFIYLSSKTYLYL